MRVTRRLHAAVIATFLAIAGLGACAGSSSGACAGPAIEVEPTTVAPGDDVTVTGHGMARGCSDHHEMGDDGREAREDADPLRDVEIEFIPEGGEPVTLTTVDADGAGSFTITVAIPSGIGQVDKARIEAAGTEASAEVTVLP